MILNAIWNTWFSFFVRGKERAYYFFLTCIYYVLCYELMGIDGLLYTGVVQVCRDHYG